MTITEVNFTRFRSHEHTVTTKLELGGTVHSPTNCMEQSPS